MEFEYNISLKDTWLEFRLNQWQEAKSRYCSALRELQDMSYDHTKPVATKTFIEDYHSSSDPHAKALFWTEVSNYIMEQECDDWKFAYLDEEEVDVNTDCYDHYEMLTNSYTVCAIITGERANIEETLEYKEQLELVQMLYNELMTMKDRIDNN